MAIETSENLWGIFYMVQHTVLSVALGCWTMHLPRSLAVPRLTRFLIGCCLPPFILGFWMLAAAALIPGAARWIYLQPPILFSLLTLTLDRGRSLRRLYHELQRIYRAAPIPWFNFTIVFGAVAVIACVIIKLWDNAQAPLIGHDALIYAGKALRFAQERELDAITGIFGAPDGAYRRDYHGFLFPAFLSHALLVSPDNALGFPYDLSLRLSFQITFIFMLLALLAVASAVRIAGVGAVAIIAFLLTPQLDYITYASSRDAFRIIPLLLLVGLLASLASRASMKRLRIAQVIPLAGLATCALLGHTLGGIIVVLLGGGWMIWGFIQRAPWSKLLLVGAALGVGLLLGGTRYLDLISTTGSIMGRGSGGFAIANTALETVTNTRVSASNAASTNWLEHWRLIFGLDSMRISVPGTISALVILAIWLLDRHRRLPLALPFLAFATILITAPYLGIFDLPEYKLSTRLTENIRYSLHWYPFLAMSIALLVIYIHRHLATNRHIYGRLGVSLPFLVALSFSFYFAVNTVLLEWRTHDGDIDNSLLALESIQPILARLPKDKRLLLDDDRYNYYLDSKAMVFYSQQSWPIIQAQSPHTAGLRLREANIQAVALQERDIHGWWSLLPLYTYVDNPKNAVLVGNRVSRAYFLPNDPAQRVEWVSDYLLSTTENLPVDQLPDILLGQPEQFRFRDRMSLPVSSDTFMAIDDPDSVITFLKDMLQQETNENTDNEKVFFNLGLLHRVKGDFSLASSYYEQAMYAGAEEQRVQVYLAETYLSAAESLSTMGHYAEASDFFRKAIENASLIPYMDRHLLNAFRTWGVEHFDYTLKQFIVQQYLAANAITPGNLPELTDMLANSVDLPLYMRIHMVEQLLQQQPDSTHALRILGQLYAEQGNSTAAASTFLNLIELAPNSHTGYTGLATLYRKQGALEKAMDLYRQASNDNPHAAWPKNELGRLYLQQAQTNAP